ncbi:MAG: N-acetyltransferase [Bacteroidetes bacterium]|nr:MAG: N-acetyltransferase [Bacteroidota bacterium]
MVNHDIKLSEQDHKGRAYLEIDGQTRAEMTYSLAGSKLLIIDHTEVDESLQGQGVGRKLLDKVIELVRERKLKVLPLCPYAKAQFEKDENIQDVLRGK